ncbi:MAG: ComEC/Rec2 family competence protein [Bacteroidales bacterium]|nr:ComEC/Rec2 family competence protein [Bacteroidales bacterium]
MQYRHLYPMVRILLPFLAGIIVCLAISATSEITLIIWISLLVLSIACGVIHFNKLRFVNRLLFGVIVSSFLFVTGYNSVILNKEILRSDHFSKMQTKGIFIASVIEPLQEKDHSFKTILSIKGIKKGNAIIEAEGRILTYFAKDSINKPPAEGSLIAFSADVQAISPPQNPGAFDYRKYMATNNVYHQVYMNTVSWKIIEQPHGFNLFRTANQISGKFVSILNENGLKGREFAVASALLLGQNDMLDNETLQAYSGSGVMHILSVSGLHVGVIFIAINFLLAFMKKSSLIIIVKTTIILLIIWAYAFLTGLSPSVMRAAAMFTFISIGNASKRNVHIVNSLSVSAIVLLLIDPLMINNIGFQLSYIAILGIVFINKPIAGLWHPANKIVAHVWGLISVSIAAQIASAPLALMYFHQFPVYFIPANLAAIDISFLAILSGIAVLLTSFIPAVSNFFGIITNFLLYIMNYCVEYIEQLPHSVLHISSVFSKETILIYLIIVSILLLFFLKRKEWLYLSLSFMLILSISFSSTEMKRQKQQKIIFYNSSKQSAIGLINGKQQILLADSKLLSDKTAIKFRLDGAKNLYGFSTVNKYALDTIADLGQRLHKGGNTLHGWKNNFLFHNKRIVIIDSLPKINGRFRKLKVDYLVITNNPKLQVSVLKQLYDPECIIIDGSNSYYRTRKWMTEFRKAGLPAYSVKDTGAYIVDL